MAFTFCRFIDAITFSSREHCFTIISSAIQSPPVPIWASLKRHWHKFMKHIVPYPLSKETKMMNRNVMFHKITYKRYYNTNYSTKLIFMKLDLKSGSTMVISFPYIQHVICQPILRMHIVIFQEFRPSLLFPKSNRKILLNKMRQKTTLRICLIS